MSKKLSNIFLLQRIMKELKSNKDDSADEYFWSGLSTSSWADIIKKKVFKEKCSQINGHMIKGLERYDGYAPINTMHELNTNKEEKLEKYSEEDLKYQPLTECIAQTLGFDMGVWKDGITLEDLLPLIDNFKENFTPPEQSHNPEGRPAHRSNNSAVLLAYIIEEIIEQDFLGTENWTPIIKKITSTTTIDTKLTKSISYWKNNMAGFSGDYQHLKQDIANTLKFDVRYWDSNNTNNFNIEDIIEKFKKEYLDKQKLKLDLSTLDKYIQNTKKNKEETYAINFLKEANTFRKMDEYFDTPDFKKLYDTSPSDIFLQESTEILYERGAYRLINDMILMKFSEKLYSTPEMKLLRAHIYGSEQVKEYQKAIDILYSIEESEMEKFADNKTALISNILRHALDTMDENTDRKELESLFVEATEKYSEIFQEYPHYYPGINYAYMLDIGINLFQNSEFFKSDSIVDLLIESQSSIDNEKKSKNTSDRYYPIISEAEFKALLGTFDRASLQQELVNIAPAQDMLIRTIRQIRFYENILSKKDIEPKQSMKDLKEFLIEFLNTKA